MLAQEDLQRAFLEWMDASRAHQASCRDRCFIDAGGKEFPTAYLMGYLSSSMDDLPANHAWIVNDNREFAGQHAVRTYQNAVRVVRAQRRQ